MLRQWLSLSLNYKNSSSGILVTPKDYKSNFYAFIFIICRFYGKIFIVIAKILQLNMFLKIESDFDSPVQIIYEKNSLVINSHKSS